MIFNSEAYFLGNKKDVEVAIKISHYNSCFKKGILICPDLLFYLIIGSYSLNPLGRFVLNNDERIKYKAIIRLLNAIKNNIEDNPPIFITPHIFTKFVYLLHKRTDREHYGKILGLLKEDFEYIKEEDIKKEKIIDFANFKNKFLGISETCLLILKERRRFPCILSLSGKILQIYNKSEEKDFLFVSFDDLVSFTQSEERKNIIR